MTKLSVSELEEVIQPSALMYASAPLDEESQNGTTEEAPNEWLVAALITLGFGLMMLPSPIAGVFIGLAPFIFSLGQLVGFLERRRPKRKRAEGKNRLHPVDVGFCVHHHWPHLISKLRRDVQFSCRSGVGVVL